MRFLHTADWQIGMKLEFAGSKARQIRDERLVSGSRVVEAAAAGGAEFMLVAGDLFEHNAVDRTLVQRTVDLLARFEGPVYLLPGNHDPLTPGSVWRHPAWSSAKNLVVLKEAAPVEIPGGFLYPCPVKEKHSGKDPTAWIEQDGRFGIRIGVAHGNLEGLPAQEKEFPIPRQAAARGGLDYLALGHWHSWAVYSDPDGATRTAYSGTCEPSRFGERESGFALLVEIAGPGAPPSVRPLRTGGLRWLSLERTLIEAGDLEKARREIESLEDPGRILLDLRLEGLLKRSEQEELSRIEELSRARFLFARLDHSRLLPSPEDSAWVELLPGGILREAAGRLQAMAAAGGPDSAAAALALLKLCSLSREMEP